VVYNGLVDLLPDDRPAPAIPFTEGAGGGAFVVPDHLDEDGRQEYLLAKLEGHDDTEALRRGGSANNAASSRRQLRTRHLMFGWVDEKSSQPRPLPKPSPSPEKQSAAIALLDICTPQQRKVIEARLGFTTGHRLTLRETAKLLGLSSPQRAFDLEQRGLNRIKRELAKPPMDKVQRQRVERKRERNRQWMAKRRAELKASA
jgi:hypothetical protein